MYTTTMPRPKMSHAQAAKLVNLKHGNKPVWHDERRKQSHAHSAMHQLAWELLILVGLFACLVVAEAMVILLKQ